MADRVGTLVILGAGGDLTKRLLLPGLGELLDSGKGGDLELLGVGQGALTDETWRERVGASFASGKADGSRSSAVARSTHYLQADVTKPDDLRRVLAACHGTPALYFALPPQVTIAACSALSSVDLPEGTVFGLEKPFGTDLESAQALNRQLLKLVPERDIHRIDHFLGKATVLNLLGLRFANRVFEQLWNAENVERVEIVFDEQLALEGRAGYYDRAGALIDMIQSHLLLVLAIVAMEPPSSIDADDLRGSIAQLLRATEAWGGDPAKASRRARYTAGMIGERSIPAYVDEKGVDPKHETETLVELTLGVQNWRWADVPFVLRSGKALARSRQEIVVTFKDVPHLPTGLNGRLAPAQLRISLSPAGISLDLNINGERDPFTLERVTVDAEFAPGAYMPYGEILAGILSADPTLSVRDDAVEQCWRIVTPILEAWKSGAVPLQEYRAGSEGPTSW